ncbi:ATP-dependent RNA helicase Dbp6p [Trichomonascus vanleenenianus]|uniref:putative ATP-dependent RNA helicase DBP6 n=1 Tax=Trichomonascus vanleenenianus TaxID=2268995 RepID=UPI003ECAAC98
MFLGTKRFDPDSIVERADEPTAKKAKVEPEGTKAKSQEDESRDDIEIDPKHAAVLQRFHATIDKLGPNRKPVEDEGKNDETEERDLVPIPIPQASEPTKKRTFAPSWITKPEYVSPETTMPFEQIDNISERMVKTLKSHDFTSAFAIQTAVIPALLKDATDIAPDPLPDVLVNAYTGSGKTLAYGVPIVEALSKRTVPKLRALIIVPTRPLVRQVRQVVEMLAKGTPLQVASLRPDDSFKQEQKRISANVPDILVTTPGRLVDHIQQRTPGLSDLRDLRYFVIDEADRLLNQSFQEWVSVVMNKFPKRSQDQSVEWHRPVQKLIFSATLTRDPGKLASLNIYRPRLFVVGEGTADGDAGDAVDYEFSVPTALTERLISVKNSSVKPLRLVQLMKDNNITSDTIVFVKSNEAASRLGRLISLIDQRLFSRNLVVERLSGELDVAQRRRILRKFEQREIGILVCTDLMARGIDISTIQYVINYDLPIGKREYVHRVGRTARAGQSGTAINIASDSGERKKFWGISKSIHRTGGATIELEKYQPEDDDHTTKAYEESLGQLENEVFSRG